MISEEISSLLEVNKFKSDTRYLSNDFTLDWIKIEDLLPESSELKRNHITLKRQSKNIQIFQKLSVFWITMMSA